MNPENIAVAAAFAQGWQDTPFNRRVEEIVSTSNETHRITDGYVYHWDEGFYMSSINALTGKREDVYLNGILDTQSYVGKKEVEVLNQLENWFTSGEEGVALWISPPYPGKYPVSKAILHQISYESTNMEKVILNAAILFDTPKDKVLGLVQEFFPETKDFKQTEELRDKLLIPKEEFNLEDFLEKIKDLDPNTLVKKATLSQEELTQRAYYVADLIQRQMDPHFIAQEMQRLGLLGEYSVSCVGGVTLSDLFGESTEAGDMFGALHFPCPKCGSTNQRPIGRLISNCQHCGADVTC